MVSFFVGVFMIYVVTPEPKVIYIYPTPENKDNIQYKDTADNCFGVQLIEKKCPMNPDNIKRVPIQT